MQLNDASQNGSPNVNRSLQWNFSSSGITMFIFPSFLSAYQSMNTSMMPAINEKIQIPSPTTMVELISPSSFRINIGIKTPPTTDASLATVMLSPSAKPSSLPLNHAEMIAD
jgi:hypothetical protein